MPEQDHTTIFFSHAVYEDVVDAATAAELTRTWETHGAEVRYNAVTKEIRISLSMFDWASLPTDVQGALPFGFL